jgi:hypothetical protein
MSDIVNGMTAYNKHKEPTKKMKEILDKNGSLSDYKKELQENPPERYKEDEIKIDFYKMLS